MGKVTFVVEFEDGQEPPVHAHMDVLGGKLVSVAWRDAIETPTVEHGWVLMPNELTMEMHSAAWDAFHESGVMSDIYKAMIEAAPEV